MKISSFAPSGSGAFIVHKILEENIKGYILKKYSPKLEYFPLLFPLTLKNNNPDIIHANPEYACFIPKKKSKLILTFHNYVLDEFMRPYSSFFQKVHYRTDLKFFIKKSLEKADLVTAVSDFTADILKKDLGYKKDVKVIYNGIDTEIFKPAEKKRQGQHLKVLFSGNLTRRKGAHWLVDISRQLNKDVIIYYTSGLRCKNKLPALPNLKCIGSFFYRDMPDLYRSMDVLLMPTIREGFSLAVLEAMASGVPVIGSKCSSLPEIIDDHENGFLCDIGDVNSFSSRINFLAENLSLFEKLSLSAREKVENKYTLNSMITNYKNLFFDS